MTSAPALNDTQMMLLRLFSHQMPPEALNQLRNMLLEFYETQLHDEIERVIEEKSLVRADFEDVLNKQQRTEIR